MMKRKLAIFSIVLLLLSSFGFSVEAEQLQSDRVDIVSGIVISIDKTEKSTLDYVGVPEETQTITAQITAPDAPAKTVQIVNDYTQLRVGEKFFANRTVSSVDGSETYTVAEPNRLGALLFFAVLFLIVLFVFGGMQGVRGLASLIGSLAMVIYVLIPGILHGYSPILVSLGVASVIIVAGSFITHGFNKTTLSAVVGMIATVSLSGLLATLAVSMTRLSGLTSDESTYLNMSTHGSLNLAGLLLGSVLIGLLGVLYDIAIGQAISVEELLRADRTMSVRNLYNRAIRIGREHIGALVNTLVIAYVGASLPLLLLFSTGGGSESIAFTLNREIFATEIIRTLIGSIGIILAVPITTYVTILILTKAKKISETGHGHMH